MARRHLAVFLKGCVEKILQGQKTVEIRFSQNRILPYEAIAKDDEILLKNSGGKIIGKATVDNVLFYDNLDKETILKIKKEYFVAAGMASDFWLKRLGAKYMAIIFLKKPVKFLAPLNYQKRDRRPWLVMEEDIKI